MGGLNPFGGYVQARGRENEPAWGRAVRGRYEVWYLTVNLPADNSALWVRYTVEGMDNGLVHAELWGHFFVGRWPTASFGLRKRVGEAELALGGPGVIRVGDALLAEGAASGEMEGNGHTLAWDLKFPPSQRALFSAPRALRPFMERRATNWCVPNPTLAVTGRIVVDGKETLVAGAPGQQAHLFGRKHAERWAWVHCNAFDGDRRTLVEGVAADVAALGSRTMTSVYVHHAGRDYLCNALPMSLFAKSERNCPEWKFWCRSGNTEFVGTAKADLSKMLQVEYVNPDGSKLHCCNTALGDLRLEVRRGGASELLIASGTANVEFAQPDLDPRVRLVSKL